MDEPNSVILPSGTVVGITYPELIIDTGRLEIGVEGGSVYDVVRELGFYDKILDRKNPFRNDKSKRFLDQGLLSELSLQEFEKLLGELNAFVLPPKIFADFLRMIHASFENGANLYRGDGTKIGTEEVGKIWRNIFSNQNQCEFLDGKIRAEENELYFRSHVLSVDGLEEFEEPFYGLRKSVTRIHLLDWLDHANSQGTLPDNWDDLNQSQKTTIDSRVEDYYQLSY